MKKNCFVLVLILSVYLAGCAEVDMPKPKSILQEPLGQSSLSLGMTKSQVMNIYGGPDLKQTVYSNDWNGNREEWFYKAEYPVIPVNTGYLSEDMYLYFDGENLTNISKTSLGKPEEKGTNENTEKSIK